MMQSFTEFWSEQQQHALTELCADEDLEQAALQQLLNNYAFANRLPREQEIIGALNFKPKILQRKTIIERVTEKIQIFINTFIEGMGGIV